MTFRPTISIGLLAGFSLLAPVAVSAATPAAKDACSLLSTVDAETALGEAVGPQQSEPRSSPDGEGSACNFRSSQSKGLKAKRLSLSVHYTNEDLSTKIDAMKGTLVTAGFKNVHEVPGVGDGAFWGTTSMMGKLMSELSVRKGKHILLIIVITGVQDEATALDRAKALAARVIPKA